MISKNKKFWLLYFLTLALELTVAGIILSRFGFGFFQGGDSPGYMLLAKNLVEHGAFSLSDTSPYIPSNVRTPGYPLFLALIYFIFHSFIPVIFFGAAIAAFTAPLIYLIAREIFPPLDKAPEGRYLTGQAEKMAFAAGILTAIEPLGLFLGVSILTEGVFTPILLLSVYFFIKYLKSENLKKPSDKIYFHSFNNGSKLENSYLYLSSFFLAAATLIRPITFYFWPIAIPFIIYHVRNQSRRYVGTADTQTHRISNGIKNSAVFIVIFFAVLSPWLVRNKISVGSWQIAGLQGYVFFIDHYGAVLRYLGEAGPLSDIQAKALALTGPDKILTSQGSDTLFKAAVSGIKEHKLVYANVYAKSLISFLVANGYKSFFIDILGIPAKAPHVPFELFLRFDFKSIFKTMAGMDFIGILIYFGGKIFWIAASGLFFIPFIYLLIKKNFKIIKAEIVFIAIIIFYFALITGPTAVSGGRAKAPINGLIFIFAVFGFYKFLDFFRKKTT